MLLFFGIGYLVGGCSSLMLAELLLATRRGRQVPEGELEAVLER